MLGTDFQFRKRRRSSRSANTMTRRTISSKPQKRVINSADVQEDTTLIKQQYTSQQSNHIIYDKVSVPSKQQSAQLKRTNTELLRSDLQELLVPTVPLLGHLIPNAESCAIFITHPITHQLSPIASVNLSQDFVNLIISTEQEEGLITAALDKEEPYLVIYIPGNKHFRILQKPAHIEGIRTLWLVPWRDHDRSLLGILLFASGQAFSPDKQALASVTLLTEWMSASLLELHTKQIYEKLDTTIENVSEFSTITGDTSEMPIIIKSKKQSTELEKGQTTKAYNGKNITYPIITHNDTQSIRTRKYKDEYGIPVLYDAVTHKRRTDIEPDAISILSHELLSPLTLIKGYAATLLHLTDTITEEQKISYLQKIGSTTDRVIHLMENLRNTQFETTKSTLVVQPTSIMDLLRKTISDLQSQTMRHLIKLHHFDHLPFINIDRQRIEQIITNLLQNAIKYSPNGGDIEVIVWHVNNEQGLKEILRKVLPIQLPSMIISVKDSGIGIPEEELDRIFERFHRVNNRITRSTSGAGLGLYLCRIAVEAHGGHIWVQSTIRRGSTFSFSLPIR